MRLKDTQDELARQRGEFSSLLAVSKLIVSELSLDAVFALVAEKARDLVQAEMVIVPILNEARDRYTYKAAVGPGAEDVLEACFPVSVGMCGWVLNNEKSLLFGKASPCWLDQATAWEKGQQSAALVPLFGRKRIIGGLSALGKKGGGSFTTHDLDLLTMFANQVSTAIENAALFAQLQKKEGEILQLNVLLERRVIERTAQLEAANNELEAFTYSVSHDLRAPLRAVDSFTTVLKENYAPRLDAEGRRICDRIIGGAVAMGKLIDDLLSFSHIGRTSLHPLPIDMTDMVRFVYDELTEPGERERVELGLAPLPPAVADPGLIHQVWTNLIANALKFSSKKKRAVIEVGAERQGDETVYFVRDNGAGFDERFKEKLFGVFQRLHSANDFAGTGVGLAIVQRIIARHGGRIWAEGEVGKGAKFCFTLGRPGSG